MEKWFSKDELDAIIKKIILPSDIVLDIGCGIRPQSYIQPKVHICCDVHDEYLKILQETFANKSALIVKSLAQDFIRWLPDRSVDTIFMLDFIEHLNKEDGSFLVSECERIARKQIILFTPLGWMEQEYTENETDGWGLKGSEWQVHRSGWTPADFGDEWDIFGAKAYHFINGKQEPFDPPFGAFYAVRNFDYAEESQSGNPTEDKQSLGGLSLKGDTKALFIEESERLAKREVELNERTNQLNERTLEFEKRAAVLYEREHDFDQKVSQINQAIIERESAFTERVQGFEHSILERENAFEKRVKDFELSVVERENALLEREHAFAERVQGYEQSILERENTFEKRVQGYEQSILERENAFEKRVKDFEQTFLKTKTK